ISIDPAQNGDLFRSLQRVQNIGTPFDGSTRVTTNLLAFVLNRCHSAKRKSVLPPEDAAKFIAYVHSSGVTGFELEGMVYVPARMQRHGELNQVKFASLIVDFLERPLERRRYSVQISADSADQTNYQLIPARTAHLHTCSAYSTPEP